MDHPAVGASRDASHGAAAVLSRRNVDGTVEHDCDAGWPWDPVAVDVLIATEIRFPIAPTVIYKDHRIRFYNNPVLGERLYIDGALVDKGGMGFNMTLRGTIESGAGAGERITAHVQCRFKRVSCQLVAESFG